MPSPSSSLRGLAAAALLVLAVAPSARAQGRHYGSSRFELVPFGGYQWGGSFDTDTPSGELSEQDSFSWGVLLSRLSFSNTAAELYYLRQDADVQFNPDREASRTVGKLANNYIMIGGRRDVPTASGLIPFVTAAFGTNILDSDAASATWRFAFSLGGGAKYPLPSNPRIALRLDVRWMVTPVPSGEYGSWCSVWGCVATQGTAWLNQGQASGGLSIGF